MFTDNNLFISQFEHIISNGIAQISTIKPSDWTEKNVIMGKPRPGPFRYDYTPYAREIIDCMAPDHPARKVAVMKGAQIGFSSGVIYPGVGWMIQNNPGNTYLMVGAPDLIPKAMEKLDLMIDGANLRSYIKPQVQRNRANKSGDTNLKKDFSGGYVSIGSANNHKAIAQVDLQYIFLDDLDAMKGDSKSSGNLIKLIEKRAAAYKDSYKMFMISTPLNKGTSLIEPAYLLGDQRRRMVECPCCHEPIIFKWSAKEGEVINPLTGEKANGDGGIFWELDNLGRVQEKSVGYICYKCAGFFNDKDKYNLLNGGYWQPTAAPSRSDYYSYHISSLYAPIGMFDWLQCARDYVECNPEGQPRKETEYQVFQNTVLGETYEQTADSPKANAIQRNCRTYKPGTVPEQQSIKDGSGRIVLLTCAIDMNGIMKDENEDVRLDYEVIAWSEGGQSYSVIHGSIGTFQRGIGKDTTDRKKWTYADNKENSVWPELEKVLDTIFQTDTPSKDSPTGYRRMKIQLSGLDCGNFTTYAYAFLDKTTLPVVGLKGEKEQRYIREGIDTPVFKHGLERRQDYILKVGLIKDKLIEYMGLNWDKEKDCQPTNFMNFPEPSEGLYRFDNYFEHFESEHKETVVDKNGSMSYRWVKKGSHVQNHMFDCRVYGIALRDIVVNIYAELSKQKGLQWRDYVRAVLG